MTIKIPVVSLVPTSESYLFSELTIEQGYGFSSLSDVTDEILRSPGILWEVESKDEMIDICRLRKGLYRDFVCVNGKVHSIYGMYATNKNSA